MIYTLTLNPAVDREEVVTQLVFNRPLRATKTTVNAGGKGFNVSRMLKILGAESTAVGLVGGYSGRYLEDQLTELGINTHFIWVKGETRTNTVFIDHSTGKHIKVNEAGPAIAASEFAKLERAVAGLAQPGDWWVLAGSVPTDVPKSCYVGLIKTIHEKGGSVLLDTSGPALQEGLAAKPDWIKPNDIELRQLLGLPDDAELSTAQDKLREMGIPHAVVSLGSKGATLIDVKSGEEHTLSPPPITESNPTGAGDALVGGFVWQLSQNASPIDAMKWGMACGSAAAELPGSQMGSFERIQALHALI